MCVEQGDGGEKNEGSFLPELLSHSQFHSQEERGREHHCMRAYIGHGDMGLIWWV